MNLRAATCQFSLLALTLAPRARAEQTQLRPESAPSTEAPAVADSENHDRPKLGIGLALAITAEPRDDHFDVAVNAVPLTVEFAFSDWVGVRAGPIVNLMLSGGGSGVAHRGGWVAVPVYLSQEEAPLGGWYVGPHVSYTVNPLLDAASDLTIAVEGGRVFDWGSTGRSSSPRRPAPPASLKAANHAGPITWACSPVSATGRCRAA